MPTRNSPFPRVLAQTAVLVLAALLLASQPAWGFPHVVQPDETLASLADRYYGRIQMERVLSTANSLDDARGQPITPGMLLEIPSVTYRRVESGDTWESLAQRELGGQHRYIFLAQTNGHKPWIQPEVGQMIRIPYNLPWRASGEESLATLAYRFLGSTKHAYSIVQYNQLGEDRPERGQLLLLPLTELRLTEEGRQAARAAADSLTRKAQGLAYERQIASGREITDLAADVSSGRYVASVARGAALLEAGELSQVQRASVQRLLLEAYVALGERGHARAACQAFRVAAPEERLDPIMTSPKILEVCPEPEPASEQEGPEGNPAASESDGEDDEDGR